VTTATPHHLTGQALEVRPEDRVAAARVDGWLRDYATSRDLALREQIILAYLGLADRLAARYRTSRGTTPEDLTQTARAALITAVDRYDPAKARAGGFVPFAVACVAGELKRSLRDTSWRVHVPRQLKDQALRVCKAVDQLEQELGRSPTAAEVAGRVQLTEQDVLEASEVASSRLELSLDCPTGDDQERCRGDLLAAAGPREEPEDLLAIGQLVARLPERERTVIILRFFNELDQGAIAARVGCSQMHVSRLLRQALGRMRAQLTQA
jgi:RNA polymerase sigma-B factor